MSIGLHYLFKQYETEKASEEEKAELLDRFKQFPNKEAINQFFLDEMEKQNKSALDVKEWDPMIKEILDSASATIIERPAFTRRTWQRVAVAASVILAIGLGAYFFVFNRGTEKEIAKTKVTNTTDVAPGKFKARLTLTDGSTIILDEAATGQLSKQGNTAVINKDGQLIYQSGAGSQVVVYNTVTTSKGETYSMTLADGSQVWLNSASSIRFPVAFPGKERRIETSGEVYVKVAKNKEQPFITSTGRIEVTALGTEFNINAYSDEESINTTLIEGSIKVVNPGLSKGERADVILKPGQQTQLIGSLLTAPKPININEVAGWKNGWFHFESADLKTILREFARWYDVEVVYEGPVKNRKFLAIIKRSSSLKTVLEMLQDNNIKYSIEGKKLIVKAG